MYCSDEIGPVEMCIILNLSRKKLNTESATLTTNSSKSADQKRARCLTKIIYLTGKLGQNKRLQQSFYNFLYVQVNIQEIHLDPIKPTQTRSYSMVSWPYQHVTEVV